MSEWTKPLIPEDPASGDGATQITGRDDDGTIPDQGSGGSTLSDTVSAQGAGDSTPVYDDLSGDSLLKELPRIPVNGREVPSVQGIRIVRKLGQGAMGAVYLGFKPMLRQYVAVKVLPMHLAELNPQLIDRFVREAQLAASIESPHLIRVTDVNESGGLFFLVMEYVEGVSAGALLRSLRAAGTALDEASALDACIAAGIGLAAAHARGIIHRDLKPDNILLPRPDPSSAPEFSRAKVADLGLARRDALGQSLTSTDTGMGTAGYMAPEQALSARTAGKPADVFGLGATLYALLAAHPPFTGGSVTEVIVKTLQEPHPPIRELRPNVSEPTAALLDRCLAKDPAQRFVDATALVEALRVCREALGDRESWSDVTARLETISQSTEVGQRIVSEPIPPNESSRTIPVRRDISESATLVDSPGGPDRSASPARRRLPFIVGGIIAIAIVVAIVLVTNRQWITSPSKAIGVVPVTLSMTTSEDRQRWLESAVEEFAKTDSGRDVRVNLKGMPGLTAENEMLVQGELPLLLLMTNNLTAERFSINWREKHEGSPFVRSEVVALSPQVFVMFEDRYAQFMKHYGALDFVNVGDAMAKRRWTAIGGPEEWGPFTFSLSDRTKSLNGIAAAILAAYEVTGVDEELTLEDVRSSRAQETIGRLDVAFGTGGGGAEIMKQLLLKGPSAYDGVCTGESAAIDYIESAEDRWGAIRVIYPKVNLWNESTVYLMNRAGASKAERDAANAFIDFLLGDTAQRKLVDLGLRPVNPDIRLKTENSPFTRLQNKGIRLEVPIALDKPNADVISALATR